MHDGFFVKSDIQGTILILATMNIGTSTYFVKGSREGKETLQYVCAESLGNCVRNAFPYIVLKIRL